jgi:hypothetical protein
MSLESVTVQGPVPAQTFPQPLKTEPGSAAAINVTALPCANDPEQVVPQLIVPWGLVTVPFPFLSTVNV